MKAIQTFFLPIISGQPLLNPQELQEKASNLPNMSPHEPPTNLQIFSSKQQTQFRKGNKVSPNFSINNQFIKFVKVHIVWEGHKYFAKSPPIGSS